MKENDFVSPCTKLTLKNAVIHFPLGGDRRR